MRANPNDPSSTGSIFKQKIDVLLPEALMTSRITTVQALLLLACTHFARGAESAAWLHSGLAFRMASDLGLFVSDYKYQVAKGQMAPEELELRRRVAWAAYTIDKIHSLYQGRQVSIRFSDIGVPASFLDSFEENEYWTPIAYQSRSKVSMFGCTVFSVSTFTQLCKLTIILEQIIETLYGVKSSQNSKQYLLTDLERLKQSLSEWFHSLPDHLRMNFRNPPPLNFQSSPSITSKAKSPNVISLNALYHCLVILLNRPFLPYGHLYDRVIDEIDTIQEDRLPLIARTAWKVCVDAAWQISHLMSLYRGSVTMKGAPQLISYINFCAAGIHVRLAAQVGPQSDEVQRKTSEEALRAVRACLEDFEENEHSNPGVAKANNVIRRMAKHFSIYPDQIEGNYVNSSTIFITDSTNKRRRSEIQSSVQDENHTISTPSSALMSNRSEGLATTSSSSNLEIMNTDLFDLNAFLSTFDDLNQPESLSNTASGGNTGDDVMFGFLKYTQ
ncbi:hypothetical protein L7F22_067875 [Adiantum nelumboides]|nr:hypothetical protein [Adiantum nelumboides]